VTTKKRLSDEKAGPWRALLLMVAFQNSKSWRKTSKILPNELRAFHHKFADCFSRSEPRENFFKYMRDHFHFSELERKSIKPTALHIEGGNVRSLQRFVSDVVWDQKHILTRYHQMVNEDPGDPEAARKRDLESMLQLIQWTQRKNHSSLLLSSQEES
jgi:hypothetical protein